MSTNEERMVFYRVMIEEVDRAIRICQQNVIVDGNYEWCDNLRCENKQTCKNMYDNRLFVKDLFFQDKEP